MEGVFLNVVSRRLTHFAGGALIAVIPVTLKYLFAIFSGAAMPAGEYVPELLFITIVISGASLIELILDKDGQVNRNTNGFKTRLFVQFVFIYSLLTLIISAAIYGWQTVPANASARDAMFSLVLWLLGIMSVLAFMLETVLAWSEQPDASPSK